MAGDGPTTLTQPRHETWTKAGPIVTAMPAEDAAIIQERSEASTGDPGAMGLFGFAVGTLLIAIPISGQLPLSTVMATMPEVLVFAGIAQFIAGLVAYRKGITFEATALCVYGANNTLIATYYLFASDKVFAATGNDLVLLGVELFTFAYISLVLTVAASKVNWAFVAILACLVPGFGLAAVTDVGGPKFAGYIGGWFLLGSAGLAFYGASALVVNSSFRRTVLPLLSRA